jgi:hypothetical protein
MHFREAYDPFRALRSSWGLLWKAPLVLIAGGLLLHFTLPPELVIGVTFDDEEGAGGIGSGLIAAAALILSFWCCFALVVGLFHALLRIGFARAVERTASGAVPALGDLFVPRGLFGSMVGTLVLVGVILLAAVAPFAVVGAAVAGIHAALDARLLAMVLGLVGFPIAAFAFLYVLLGVALAPDAVAFESMRPTEAIARSWILTRGNRWCLFLYLLVLWIARAAGVLLCCVGSLVTIPWTVVAGRESYLRMIRDDPPR